MARIMIIRHAEKPSQDGSVKGVDEAGNPDPHELSVKGWQRAGGLVQLFAPSAPRPIADPLKTPVALFASAATKASPSLRPQHTIDPLAAVLVQVPFHTEYSEGEEPEIAAAVKAVHGDVLISWHHEHIVSLVQAIAGLDVGCPAKWPDDRFDMIWVLDRDETAGIWRFEQYPQLLLSGDRPDPIV